MFCKHSERGAKLQPYAAKEYLWAQGHPLEGHDALRTARMAVVSESVHPAGLDFANQRKLILLRDVHGLTFPANAEQVVNLTRRGEQRRTTTMRFPGRWGLWDWSFFPMGSAHSLVPAPCQRWPGSGRRARPPISRRAPGETPREVPTIIQR